MLRDSDRSPYVRGALLARQPLVAKARELMMEYDIRAPGPGSLVARLSGGNQQKIVVARELDRVLPFSWLTRPLGALIPARRALCSTA